MTDEPQNSTEGYCENCDSFEYLNDDGLCVTCRLIEFVNHVIDEHNSSLDDAQSEDE